MTSRRAFLLGAVTALAAPAIVRASSLMPLYVPPKKIIIDSYGGTVYFMQGRQFFVYNGGTTPLHLSKAIDFGEWAVTLDPGEQMAVPA